MNKIENFYVFWIVLLVGSVLIGGLSGYLFNTTTNILIGAGVGGSLWFFILIEYLTSKKLLYG